MTKEEFDAFMGSRRYSGTGDYQLENIARAAWNHRRETGRWLMPEADDIARECVARGWAVWPPLRVTVTDHGYIKET